MCNSGLGTLQLPPSDNEPVVHRVAEHLYRQLRGVATADGTMTTSYKRQCLASVTVMATRTRRFEVPQSSLRLGGASESLGQGGIPDDR